MIDEVLVDKTELLHRLQHAHMRFNALLNQLSEAQLNTPNALGAWSVKDLLAHLIAHEQRALDELRHALRGERLAIDHAANDRFNAQAVLASRERSAAEVRAAWEASLQRVVSAVEALSAEDFDPTGKVAHWLDDTIDGALSNNTYGHTAEHLPTLEIYLQSLEP